MPATAVKLAKRHGALVPRWSRSRRILNADLIRDLIDRAGPIITGDDLLEWVDASEGKGLGLAQKKA